MKIKDLPVHMRPRERLIEKGVENLKDDELLAILLRTGKSGKSAIELADQILRKIPRKDFVNAKFEDFHKIEGIDSSKACTLLAAIEFVKRATNNIQTILPTITETRDVVNLLSEMRHHKKEHFIVLYLNARNEVIHKETVFIGTVNSSMVHPREVFEPAIRVLAVQIILAHNHPSGDISPSEADIETTDRMINAGELLGISILDHVIIGQNTFSSMRELGILE